MTDELNGPQRAAMLVAAMDRDTASALLEHMSEDAVNRLEKAVRSLKNQPVGKDQKISILRDYLQATRESGFVVGDAEVRLQNCVRGASAAQDEEPVESEETEGQEGDEGEPAGPVRQLVEEAEPAELADVIAGESLRCGAVVMELLPPEKTGEVLEELSPEKRSEVVNRTLETGRVRPEVAREIASGVLSRLHQSTSPTGGMRREERISRLAFMFGSLEDEERKEAMEQLREQEPEVADEVQRKMFAFEDLEWVEERSLQNLLGRMEPGTLALALKGASSDIEQVIMDNISSRMQDEVQEERELAGSVPLSKAEEAREEVMTEARQMNNEGELEFVGGEGDEYVE